LGASASGKDTYMHNAYTSDCEGKILWIEETLPNPSSFQPQIA